MKLNNQLVDALKAQEKTYLVRDEALSRFAIRVTRNGVKTYVVRIRNDALGIDKWLKVGSAKDMSSQEARSRAMKMLVAPKTTGLQTEANISVGKFIELYMERHVRKENRPVTAQDKAMYAVEINRRFERLPLAGVQMEEVRQWHIDMKKRKGEAQANRHLSMLKHMMTKAVEWNILKESNLTSIKPFKEVRRDRWLNEEEFSRFIKAVDEEPLLYRVYLRLLIHTGCRPGSGRSKDGEARYIRRSQVNFNNKLWVLSMSKNGEVNESIPLDDEICELLKSLPERSDLFFEDEEGRLIAVYSKHWKRIMERAQLSDFHLHDIRRTVASHLLNNGLAISDVGKLLRHKTTQTTEIYARAAEQAKRKAVDRLGGILTKIQGKPGSTPA